ncbi:MULTISPECIES: lipopolysaccharide biosynthesis protein [Rhodanobacter]|uniref:lipopolysaccharide biosynthesis protein n=1 Tax=Rhodanobacter TaxID=75309 RepID=UPI000917781E|nr:lipopolysaccharide biosynthesis protein [Rhodanobacter thiooxydans]UJJ54313.1 lipopolysaccharide biosynthesis protein [Rhodanobacter thiooxydans]
MPDNEQKQRTSVRQALSLSFVQRLVGLVFSFGSVVIISRLLTPAEVGVFSVAAGVVALINMLRDFGVSEFVVQEPVLDEALVRTVFTINLMIAWVLGGIIIAASGVIGAFYGDPGVTRVLKVLGFVFFLLPFGTTAMALLNRELEYGKLAKIRISESIIRSCTAVALAYAGFTYMSIAWASVAGISALIVGCTLWGWQYRVKGLSFVHWKRVLHFGSNRTISDVASQLGEQSASLVIGKMSGMTDVGLFSRGYGVVNMYRTNVLGAIGAVAFPAFAREHREHATAPELFLRALVYTTGISWPFFACGVILAYPIINILFGDQWDAAVPLMRWLCLAAFIGTLMFQCNLFLVALGRVRAVTRVEVQYQTARIGITVGAAFYGVTAVAAAQVLVYIIATVLYYRKMRNYDALAVRKCARALVPSAVVTLGACAVPAALVLWPELMARHMLLAFALALVGGGAGWLLGLAVARHPLLDELKRVVSRVYSRYHLVRG